MDIIQRFQNKYLTVIVNAPWYVTLYHDLNVPYVTDEIKKLNRRFADKLEEHLTGHILFKKTCTNWQMY